MRPSLLRRGGLVAWKAPPFEASFEVYKTGVHRYDPCCLSPETRRGHTGWIAMIVDSLHLLAPLALAVVCGCASSTHAVALKPVEDPSAAIHTTGPTAGFQEHRSNGSAVAFPSPAAGLVSTEPPVECPAGGLAPDRGAAAEWPGNVWPAIAGSSCDAPRGCESVDLPIVARGHRWPQLERGEIPEGISSRVLGLEIAEADLGEHFSIADPQSLPAPAPIQWPDSSAMNLQLPVVPASADSLHSVLLPDLAEEVLGDFRQFYSPVGIVWLVGGVGAGAAMANTGFDNHFMRDTYADNIVLAPSNELYEKLHQPKFLGDGYYTIPAFAVATLAGPLIDDLPLGAETAEWGRRSLRSILVGGPPVLGLQWITGGGRPDETASSSAWRPFRDNNGVSGHSFMGAIPFMSAAKMTDNIWLKGGLYAASALPAISRINDDAHFFSQAFLGWWLAYLAESAVDRSMEPCSHRQWHIYPSAEGLGLTLSTQW